MASACKIPFSYLETLPTSLAAENINYGIYKKEIRKNYDLLVQEGRVLGLMKKGSSFSSNKDIVDAINSVVYDEKIDGAEYTKWEVSDTASAVLVTFGDKRIRPGFLLLNYYLTSEHPYAYMVVYEEGPAKDESKLVILPGDHIMRPANYASSLRLFISTKIEKMRDSAIDGYTSLKTLDVVMVFQNLENMFKSLELGKKLKKKIHDAYSNKCTIYNLYHVLEHIYRDNNHPEMLKRVRTGRVCGNLLLKVIDYESRKL